MIVLFAEVIGDSGDLDGHMDWGGGWWMFIWGTLMMVAIIVFAVWVLRTATTPGRGDGASSDPLDSARRILAERFARGELSSDEYQERVDQLR